MGLIDSEAGTWLVLLGMIVALVSLGALLIRVARRQ